jgi:hypothetical protein
MNQDSRLGRQVMYTLTEADADKVNARRAEHPDDAPMLGAGERMPATIVRTAEVPNGGGRFADEVELVVQAGPEPLWILAATEGTGAGHYLWPGHGAGTNLQR